MTAAATALATIGRCLDALGADDLSAADRSRVLALANESRRLLETSARLRRLSTAALARRVVAIEATLADRRPGERRAIVCERLGLSRAHYYRLRKSHSDETGTR